MKTQTVVRKKTRHKQQESRFQRLWSEAEALEKENLELESQLDELVKRIDTEVFQAERKLGAVIYDVVTRQLDFAQRKSLLKWQRSELSDWIDENLSELSAMGMVDEAMQNRLATLRAAELGIEIDPESDLSPSEQLEKFFDDDAAEFRRQFQDDPEDDSEGEGEQADLFDDDSELVDDEDEILDDDALAELLRKLHEAFEERQRSVHAESAASPRKTVSDAVFKRLFRQTATALHPDKEADEQRRQEKHELMSQLLKARKEFDLITILRLHEQYAIAESELDSADQEELEGILVEYLNQQKQRLDEIVRKSPIHHMAFTEFYHKKPATVTRRINAHLKKIDEKKQGLLFFTEHVKTLKSLKQILASRYDASMWRGY